VLIRSGARLIGNDIGVGNRRVPLRHDQADIKGRLICRLIKRGKSPARVRRLKLGDRVVPLGGAGKIEAAQISIQNAAVGNFQGHWPGRQLARKVKGSLLQTRIKGHLRWQSLTAGFGHHRVKLELPRVQHNRICRLRQGQVDGFLAGEGR
jgi:hypothetical protein